jgi:hypothetical protein
MKIKNKTIKQVIAECDSQMVWVDKLTTDGRNLHTRINYDKIQQVMSSHIKQRRDLAAMKIGKK